ncbi:hypothetical protein BS47DRAFT_1364092 [Hydnum rufescens UP504]|uniref:Uncharacterized protein n=1 Tax=Hydnum rufescens UP504 TaxID=1448309 RepID=A0A9P6DTW5_9AGAM|nr:hypothetical protein BS47DRAFT_1364092 [Hydnum rufescens UP504]
MPKTRQEPAIPRNMQGTPRAVQAHCSAWQILYFIGLGPSADLRLAICKILKITTPTEVGVWCTGFMWSRFIHFGGYHSWYPCQEPEMAPLYMSWLNTCLIHPLQQWVWYRALHHCVHCKCSGAGPLGMIFGGNVQPKEQLLLLFWCHDITTHPTKRMQHQKSSFCCSFGAIVPVLVENSPGITYLPQWPTKKEKQAGPHTRYGRSLTIIQMTATPGSQTAANVQAPIPLLSKPVRMPPENPAATHPMAIIRGQCMMKEEVMVPHTCCSRFPKQSPTHPT